MLHTTTIKFLKDLKKNNTKEWFDANRKTYENAKGDYTNLVAEIIKQFSPKDAGIAELQPKDCMFRINRDVRFSKDKSPYKTNMGAFFATGGKKSPLAGYYFHLEPGSCFVGGGLWMPDAANVKKVRQEIDYSWEEFSGIIHSKKFKTLYGELDRSEGYALSREPKGYEKDNPAIEYIKLKSWVANSPVNDSDLTDKSLVKKIIAAFETLQPMITFLNKGLEG